MVSGLLCSQTHAADTAQKRGEDGRSAQGEGAAVEGEVEKTREGFFVQGKRHGVSEQVQTLPGREKWTDVARERPRGTTAAVETSNTRRRPSRGGFFFGSKVCKSRLTGSGRGSGGESR